MADSIIARLKNGWNAFLGRDPTEELRRFPDYGYVSSMRPDRPYFSHDNKRSIIAAIYNRIAMDVASIDIEHVRVDDNGFFSEKIDSNLNECFQLSANTDQTGPALVQDIVMSMFDEGCIAVVPVDTTGDPNTGTFDVLSMRTAKIVQWYPMHVKVRLYNDRHGRYEEIILSKSFVAIIENPFYAVMNEQNSTLQRLIRTLNQLDRTNQQNASGKMDLIIQLPYTVKNQTQQARAEARRKSIEMQLTGSKYGIAYIDGTEHVTQLNRAVENQLWSQVTELTTQLYNELGMAQTIFDGTADEKVMQNYYTRTIDPILTAICLEIKRKFLSKTARTQGQSIQYFRDPFSLVPASDLAEIADKLSRNEILSSNELRASMGYKPVDDPRANELRNKNLNAESDQVPISTQDNDEYSEEYYEQQ